jgi:UDP-glucuronate 4-epimerase
VTSLQDLVGQLEQVLGKQAVLDRLPDQPGDVQQTYADTSLAEAELGYRSQTPVAEGLARFCAWYLEERDAGRLS